MRSQRSDAEVPGPQSTLFLDAFLEFFERDLNGVVGMEQVVEDLLAAPFRGMRGFLGPFQERHSLARIWSGRTLSRYSRAVPRSFSSSV